MSEAEILTRLGLALAIGFLVGVERGWRERQIPEGERAAGLRTFSLVGLAGGVFALLALISGPLILAAAFLAVGGTVAFFRWREVASEGNYGATTVVAALLTFGLGAYAVMGDMAAAAAAAVATTAILAAKSWLHAWLQTLTWQELRATLILAAMSFVALPVLPDRGFGPYGALNPRDLWLMTIAIAGVSFIGYVAVKVVGGRYGPLIAGIAGGVVSSTITTVDLGRRARQTPATRRAQLAGALAASATMFIRIAVVVALFGPRLLPAIAGPLAAALVVSALAAGFLAMPGRAPAPDGSATGGGSLTNPFELKTVLLFAVLLTALVLVSRVLTELYGGSGGIVLAAVAGLGDVDAVTLSMTRLGGSTVSVSAAAVAVLVVATSNTLSKSGLALITGGRWYGLGYLAVSLVSIAAGAAVALSQSWAF